LCGPRKTDDKYCSTKPKSQGYWRAACKGSPGVKEICPTKCGVVFKRSAALLKKRIAADNKKKEEEKAQKKRYAAVVKFLKGKRSVIGGIPGWYPTACKPGKKYGWLEGRNACDGACWKYNPGRAGHRAAMKCSSQCLKFCNIYHAMGRGKRAWVTMTNWYRCMYNSPQLKWSDDLAKSATAWAKKGTLNHYTKMFKKTPGTPTANGPFGENIFMYKNSQHKGPVSPAAAINVWYQEIVNCGKKPGCIFGKNGVVGHYTAMIWKGAKTMGCGQAQKGSKFFLVCRYRGGSHSGPDTPNFRHANFPANVPLLTDQKRTLQQCQGKAFLKSKGVLPKCKCKSKCWGPVGADPLKKCYTTEKCAGAYPSMSKEAKKYTKGGWFASTPSCNPGHKFKTSKDERKEWQEKRAKGFKCHKFNRTTKKLQDQKPKYCTMRKKTQPAFCCNIYDNTKCGIMPMWDYCAKTCQSYNEKRCVKVRAALPEGAGCRRRRRFNQAQMTRELKVKRLNVISSLHRL